MEYGNFSNPEYEYWRDLYLCHSETTAYKRKIEKSKTVIQTFLQEHGSDAYVSLSAGKDSTAMAHLVWSIDPTIKMMSQKDSLDFPTELDYLNTLKTDYGFDLTVITPNVNLWEVIKTTDFLNDVHSRGTEFSDSYFYGLIREFQQNTGLSSVFLGLRAEESKQRQWNFKKRGFIYKNNTWQQWVCQPLALWSGFDVMAYLFENRIPILDVYFKTKFVKYPHDIRKSWILPSHQASQGQISWLRYYYPDEYNRLQIINSKMRSY